MGMRSVFFWTYAILRLNHFTTMDKGSTNVEEPQLSRRARLRIWNKNTKSNVTSVRYRRNGPRFEVHLISPEGEKLVSSRCKTEQGALRIAEAYSRIHSAPIFYGGEVKPLPSTKELEL